MTIPLGGNAVNLAALAVPIMPETSHLGEQMSKVGEQMHRDLMAGFSRASGSSGGESVGSAFANQWLSGFKKTAGSADFGFITTALNRVNERVDERMANVLRAQLPGALAQYKRATDEVTEAEERHRLATERLTTAKNAQGVPYAAMVSLMRDEKRAHDDLITAHGRASDAQENLTTKTNEFQAASARVLSTGAVMGGLVGGGLVIGFNLLSGAMEGVIHTGEHLFEGALEGAKELVDKVYEVGEAYANLRVQTVEFSGASGDALEEMNEHVATVFSKLDVEGRNLGQTYAQLHSMLGLEPGAGLDDLARKVIDLQGRFSNLKAQDLGAVFRLFNIDAKDFSSTLDTLVDNASHAGEGLGDLASDLKGKVGATLAEANVSIGNSAWFLGELHRMGIPATDVVTGLSTAMTKLTKSGMDFPSAMREVVKELLNATQAQKDEAAATLFGGRRFTEVLPALEALNQALNDHADAHNGAAGAAQGMIDKTETLHNKWEELKHQIESMAAPFGEKFLEGLETAIGRVHTYVSQHIPEIMEGIRGFGHAFINFLPTLKELVPPFLAAIGAMAVGVEELAGSLMLGAAGMQALAGNWDQAADLFKKGSDLMLHGPGKTIKLFQDLNKHINDIHIPTDQWNKDLDETIDKTENWATSQENLNGALRDYSNVAPSAPDTILPGSGGGPGLPGGGPGLPRGGITPIPPGGTPGVHSAVFNSGDVGGDAEGPMRARIMQLSQLYGLTPTETSLIMGVGKHESNWSGPGYMGFGPEWRNATGSDFRNAPTAAVDQFFRQFMERRAAEGNPNDPSAVANYIWHTVHGASDPNYGPELLAASGFADGGTIRGYDDGGSIGETSPLLEGLSWLWHDTPHEWRWLTQQQGAHSPQWSALDPRKWHFAEGGLIGAGLFSGLLDSLGIVTGGKGGIDDVLIRATAGETVMNKRASEMFGPQLKMMNAMGNAGSSFGRAPGAFAGGGKVGGDSDSGVLQVIWAGDPSVGDIGEAAPYGWVGPGTSQPQYYGSDWKDHTGHVHTSFSRNPYTGEPYTQVPAGSNIRQGQPGFPSWVYQLGDQFGLDASTYPGHQEWGGVNHGIDWWPRGKANMTGQGYTGEDRGMLTSFAEAVGMLGAGAPGGGGTGSGGGGFGVSAADFRTGGGDGGRGGGGWNPFTGGGPGGAFNPHTGLPGLPGQYGGYGTYGGETYDDQIMKNRAVQDAQDRIGDLEKRRDKIQNEDLPKVEDELKAEQAKLPAMQDQAKITSLNNEIKDKQAELDKINNRDLPRAREDVGMAERRRDEAANKSPEGMKGAGKDPQFNEAQQLGRGLLSGVAQELGFPDVFGKPIWEFGAFKMLTKGLNIGWSWLNEIGDRMSAGNSSGQFPVGPQEVSPFGPDRGAAPGPDINPGLPGGLNIHMPVNIPHTGQPPAQTGGQGAPGMPRDPERNMQPSWRSPEGTTMPASYHIHHHEGDTIINGVPAPEVTQGLANYKNSYEHSQAKVNSPAFPQHA